MRSIRFAKCCTHLDVADREVEAAIEVAVSLSAGTLDCSR
jgi:hypothetical protein